MAVGIVVGDLEPGVAVAILPGGDAAPADNARVEVALVEQEPARFLREEGTLEVAGISAGVETVGFLLHGLRVGIFTEDDIGIIREPLASFRKRLVQITHHQVNRSSRGIAYVAFIRVAAHVEMEAGVTVVVKRAERHVAHGLKAEPHGHSLNRKGTEIQYVSFFDHSFQVFSSKFNGLTASSKFKVVQSSKVQSMAKAQKFEDLAIFQSARQLSFIKSLKSSDYRGSKHLEP